MSEPRLEDISDYNKLEGEKKSVVISVVIIGLILGTIYAFASRYFQVVDDALPVDKTYKQVPMR